VKERWQELDEFPDYAISSFGEVTNIKTSMPRKTSINQQGIVKISLYQGRELITRSVAVMVAEAFCEGQTEFFNTPIHLDGDRQNCRADNLMWRPRWFAVQYHRQFEIDTFHKMDVHIEELNSGKEYYSVKEACMDLGLYYNDVYRSYLYEQQIRLTRHEFALVE
jgi:NUMOD4 motif